MKHILILLTLLWPTIITHAQPHDNWINYTYSFRVFDIDIDGDDLWIGTWGGLVKHNKKTGTNTYYNRANTNLPGNNMLGIFCADNGDIWVSSKYYGIGKLSNSNCKIYNQSNSGLPYDQYNMKVKLDNEGNLWVASFRWMAKYDGNEWKTWTTGEDISPFPVIQDFDIAEDGTVWLFSADGIGKIENDEYTIVSTSGSALAAKNGGIKIDKLGNIWVALENEGIYKYDGSVFTNYNTDNSCLPTNYIYAIDFDSENNMWLATIKGLVSFKKEVCETFQPLSKDSALLSLKCDENNVVWCGTISGKLLKFDDSGFSTIELSNSPLKSNNATPLFTDNNNHVWLRTTENIVKKSSYGLFSLFDKDGYAATQDNNGDIWLGFMEGDTCLLKITDNENIVFRSLMTSTGTSKNTRANSFAVDAENNLWISTKYYGLFKYNGVEFINYTAANSALPTNEVYVLAFDSNNSLWGGTARGLFKFDGTNWFTWNTNNSIIPTNVVTNLIIDTNDVIWFSCMDESRIAGKQFGGGLTKLENHILTNYNINNSGLLSNTIGGIADDGDKLWLATYAAGLMSFDKNDTWEVYNVTNSGIAHNVVQGLVIDNDGSIWMGHNSAGISVFNPDSDIQKQGLIDDIEGAEILVYPNPAKDEFFVVLNQGNETIIKTEIFDTKGRLMQTLPVQTSNYAGSIYTFKVQQDLPKNQILILRLETKDGKVINGKIMFTK